MNRGCHRTNGCSRVRRKPPRPAGPDRRSSTVVSRIGSDVAEPTRPVEPDLRRKPTPPAADIPAAREVGADQKTPAAPRHKPDAPRQADLAAGLQAWGHGLQETVPPLLRRDLRSPIRIKGALTPPPCNCASPPPIFLGLPLSGGRPPPAISRGGRCCQLCRSEWPLAPTPAALTSARPDFALVSGLAQNTNHRPGWK